MIPKLIHYCWFGDNPKPKSVKKCINSWKKYCPDYEIIEWNESNYDVHKNQYMSDAYKEKKWGFVPDFARLDIIYNYGGVYLDTDVEMVKSFDDLLSNDSFFGFENEKTFFTVALGLGFGAKKNSDIIKFLLDAYSDLSFYNEDGSLRLIPAPVLQTPLFEKLGIILDNSLQSINGITVFPFDFFDPKDRWTGLPIITQNTYSIHHYDSTWVDEKIRKEINDRWKKTKKIRRKDYLIHIPNRVLLRMLGENRYGKLKNRFNR